MSISSVQTNDICLKIIIPHPIINNHHETSVVSDNRLEATRSGFENIWAMTASRILHNTLFRIDFFALLCPKTNYFEYVHIYVWCFHSKTNKIKSFCRQYACMCIFLFLQRSKNSFRQNCFHAIARLRNACASVYFLFFSARFASSST